MCAPGADTAGGDGLLSMGRRGRGVMVRPGRVNGHGRCHPAAAAVDVVAACCDHAAPTSSRFVFPSVLRVGPGAVISSGGETERSCWC